MSAPSSNQKRRTSGSGSLGGRDMGRAAAAISGDADLAADGSPSDLPSFIAIVRVHGPQCLSGSVAAGGSSP